MVEENKRLQKKNLSDEESEALVYRFFHAHYRENQVLCARMLEAFRDQPELFVRHAKAFAAAVHDKHTSTALLRNALRICSKQKVRDDIHGKIFDRCLELVKHPQTDAAIKAYALTVLEQVSLEHPDILPELQEVILPMLPFEKASFTKRARFLFKQLI